jgi:hypothetical protein
MEKEVKNDTAASPLTQYLFQTIIKSSGKDSLPAGKEGLSNN